MTALKYLAAIMMLAATAQVGFAQHGNCKPDGCGESSCGSCEPTFLCCQSEVKVEKITRTCFDVECEYVCIPPVKLPDFGGGLCNLFGSKCDDGCLSGCGNDSCTGDCAECCTDGCETSNGGFMSKLCSKLTDCRIRKVNTFKKREIECGERCVVEWKVVCMQAPGCDKCGSESCFTAPGCCAPCGE